jgi:hypothetical protein
MMCIRRPRPGAREPPHDDLIDEVHRTVEPDVDHISQHYDSLPDTTAVDADLACRISRIRT